MSAQDRCRRCHWYLSRCIDRDDGPPDCPYFEPQLIEENEECYVQWTEMSYYADKDRQKENSGFEIYDSAEEMSDYFMGE